VNFCIWKSLSGVGRTYLHNVQCPLLGEQKFARDCLGLGCEKMISAEYLRTGVISKLREGFRSIGLTSNWDEISSSGNPALAHSRCGPNPFSSGLSNPEFRFFYSSPLVRLVFCK
jgi:hypothetical protein